MARTTERYTAVQQLLSEGVSLAAIGRQLRLDHSTVRRFDRARSLGELLVCAGVEQPTGPPTSVVCWAT
ncbi:helix-turn-helix domain-containing protein [Streptomyces mirabilis]